MEPSAGVPGPTGNQHFQMPLNSWLSEAEKLLVPPQHHRVVNKSSVYSSVRVLRWVWGRPAAAGSSPELLQGWMLGREVAKALLRWPQTQDSGPRQCWWCQEGGAGPQRPSHLPPPPLLLHKGLTRGSDLGWSGAQPAITAVLEGFQMRARLQFSELEQQDIFINT